MIQTSDAFAALIDTAPEILHLTLPGGTEVPQRAIQKAYWVGGTNAGDDITLGSTVALQLQAELKRSELGGLDLTDTRLTATLTITGADDVLPVAVLQVDKPNSDDDVVTITACDAMIYAFSVAYALDDTALGFDWEAGVDGETLLQAICDACGVTLATTGLTPVTLTNYTPSGHTYREVIAFLSCLWGRFARMNGKGELVLGWYTAADRPVFPARYYQGELKKADFTYTVGYIKCYNETLEESMTAGDASAAQGIYIECPWMTPERLRTIFQEIGGFAYRPVSELRFLGDPRLEPGDVLQVTDRDGTTYTVPVMTLRQEYDGGLISQVTAVGKSVSASEYDYEGPVTREIKKAVRGVKSSLVRLEDSITAKVEAVDGRCTTIQQTVDGITLEVVEQAGADGQVYAQITLGIGPNKYSGYIQMTGNLQVSGQLSADALYAKQGDIADLTVDSLSTSRRVALYLAKNMSDDNYIRIHDEQIEFVTGTTDGSREQATTPEGLRIYWEADIEDAEIGADGYPYIDGQRIYTTTAETDWPVYVYTYTELVKASLHFEMVGEYYLPIMTFGAGDNSGWNKAWIVKEAEAVKFLYRTSSGTDLGMVMYNTGHTDVYGLRRTTFMDFSEWSFGKFYEMLDGIDKEIEYGVTFDELGRPVKITEGEHVCDIRWGDNM